MLALDSVAPVVVVVRNIFQNVWLCFTSAPKVRVLWDLHGNPEENGNMEVKVNKILEQQNIILQVLPCWRTQRGALERANEPQNPRNF